MAVIYTEEPAVKTVSYAGKSINKKLELPLLNDKDSPHYTEARDYTPEQASGPRPPPGYRAAVHRGPGGRHAPGYHHHRDRRAGGGWHPAHRPRQPDGHHPSRGAGSGTKTEEIDEALKTIGNYKDEKPVTIFLVSHLKNVEKGRTPHEEGGEVSSPIKVAAAPYASGPIM